MWRERLARYRQSDVSVAAFCAAEGVSLAAFYGWRRRLREAVGPACGPQVASPVITDATVREAAGDPAALFVPVAVRASVGEVRIEVPGGVVVRLPLEVDERLLRDCLRAALQATTAGEDR
jgi:transposase-like protein